MTIHDTAAPATTTVRPRAVSISAGLSATVFFPAAIGPVRTTS